MPGKNLKTVWGWLGGDGKQKSGWVGPFLHVGVIVGWLGYLLLLRTVAPHVMSREWGLWANEVFSCEVPLTTAEKQV